MTLLSENKKSKVLFFLMGLFVFSNIYKLVLSSVFGIGLALPEILLIPFVIALRKEIKLRVNIYLFFFTIGFWLFLYYLGTTQLGSGSLFTHSRGFLYIFLCFIIFKNPNTHFNIDYFFFLSFGSLCGWLLTSLFNLILLSNLIEDVRGFTYGNLLSIPIFLGTSYLSNKKFWFYIGLCILIAIIFTAGLRRVIVVVLVSLLILFFFPSKNTSIRKQVISLSILAILVYVVFINIDIIGKIVYDFSPSTYHRVFEKTSDSMGDDMIDEDIKRISFIEYYQQHYHDDILPNGFLRTSPEYEFGRYNDFPVLELSYTFGFFGLLIISLYFLRCFILTAKLAYYYSIPFIFLIPGAIVFLLCFMDGSILTNPTVTPLTGMCLGKMALFSNTKIQTRFSLFNQTSDWQD